MLRTALASAVLLLAAAAPALAADNLSPSSPLPASAAGVPQFAHIVIIVMENRGDSAIMGSASAPYINSLASSYTWFDNYSAVAHPSLPNYLALTGGDTFGITSDCQRCFVSGANLGDSLAGAGISGTAYMEDMPSACFLGDSGEYVQKHDPWVYFDSVRTTGKCQSVVPFSQLWTDLAGNHLPAYVWITPNSCHDMHDCSVATGDRWLANVVPQLLDSPAFTQQDSLLAIVWDEDDGRGDNHVPLILAGPSVKRGSVSHVAANHYSLLRTVEAAWNLPALTANDAAAQPLTDALIGF
jgi:phospholipase C